MIIMRLILLTALIIVMSCMVGVAAVKFFDGKDYGIGKIYIYGQLVILASFELVGPVAYLFQRKLTEVMVAWGIILLLLLFACVKSGMNMYSYAFKYNLNNLKNNCGILGLIVALLVAVQVMFVLWFTVEMNTDDWFWMGDASKITITNRLNMFDETTGQVYGFLKGVTAKRWLSPWTTLLAILGKTVNVHTTIIAHTVVSGIAMLDMYVVLYQICKILFSEIKYRKIFMIVMSVVKYFNNFSIFYYSCYMYLIPWQGKPWMTSIMFPLIFYVAFIIVKNEYLRLNKEWLLLGIILMDTMLVNSLGTLLSVSIVVSVFAWMAVIKRNVKYLLNTLVVSIPELIGLIITWMIRF